MYVPLNLEDERAFNEELKRYGIENEMALVTESLGNYYPCLLYTSPGGAECP